MEPETTYRVENVDKSKIVDGTPYTEIKVTVINRAELKKGDAQDDILNKIQNEPGWINWIIDGFQSLKKSIYHFFISFYFSHFFIHFTEKKKDPKWLLKRIGLYRPYSEFCSFYLNLLKDSFDSTSLGMTTKKENIIKAGEYRGVKILSEVLESYIRNLNICTTTLYAMYLLIINYGK